MSAIVSFVRRYGDDDTVVVLLGDHQPATTVSGQGAGHDVPISIIAKDPKVMRQVAGWGWQDGLHPAPRAPTWPMSAFRDPFLGAFGSRAAWAGRCASGPSSRPPPSRSASWSGGWVRARSSTASMPS